MSDSDLVVEVSIEGEERSLPPLVDVSAYRIVQEALTNTLKHSAASRADVHVRYWPGELEVEIVDDGRGATRTSAIVGEAANGEQAAASSRRLRPDVVLMDIQMPDGDGLQATRRITDDRELRSRVVILTTFERDEYVFEALQSGATRSHAPARHTHQ